MEEGSPRSGRCYNFFCPGEDKGVYIGPLVEGSPLNMMCGKKLASELYKPLLQPSRAERELGKTSHEIHHELAEKLEEDFEHTEEAKEGDWFAEFTDLIFVAIIIKLADPMKYTYKCTYSKPSQLTRLILESLLFYTGFFMVWLELTVGCNRFLDLGGVADDLLWILYMLGVIVMAVQVPSKTSFEKKFAKVKLSKPQWVDIDSYPDIYEKEFDYACKKYPSELVPWMLENSVGYSCGLLIICLSLYGLHYLWHEWMPEARHYTSWRKTMYMWLSVLCIVAIAIPYEAATDQDDFRYWLQVIIISSVLGTFGMVNANSFRVLPNKYLDLMPHNTETFAERFGILIMILIGESVLALILLPIKHTFDHYFFIIFAFLIMYFFKEIYFGSSCNLELHALNTRESPGSITWIFLHWPLTYALLGVGVAFKIIVVGLDDYEQFGKPIPKSYMTPMAITIPLSIGIMWMTRAAHQAFLFPCKSWLYRPWGLIAIAVGPFLGEGMRDTTSFLSWILFWELVCYAWDPILRDVEEDPEVKELRLTGSRIGEPPKKKKSHGDSKHH